MLQMIFLALLFLFSSFLSPAQNLIANPGFEEDEKVKKYYFEKQDGKITRKDYLGLQYVAKYWLRIYPSCNTCDGNSSSTMHRVDYYTRKLYTDTTGIYDMGLRRGEKPYDGVPENIFGEQEPHSGIAYSGFFLNDINIEYLQVKLKDSLIAGKEYCIRLFASLAEDSLILKKDTSYPSEPVDMNSFGVYLSRNPVTDNEYFIEKVNPSVFLKTAPEINNRKDWGLMAATYKAKGGEKYFVFGYFGKETKKEFRPFYRIDKEYNSYFYIDDICVAPLLNGNCNCRETMDTFIIGKPFVLENINFKTGSHELLPSSFEVLDKLMKHLQKNPSGKIEISGHTDNVGNEKDNLILSEQRAKAVADYLISKGIAAGRIQHRGFGSSQPVAGNATEEGRLKNRRVEFILR